MSTQINITVGGGGIVGAAQRQQEEARWRQAEKERRVPSQPAAATVRGDAVPERLAGFRYSPDEPAANRRLNKHYVGNGWLWQTTRVTDARYYGDASTSYYTQKANVVAYGVDRKIGSMDGTAWLEWTDTYSGSGVAPTPPGVISAPSAATSIGPTEYLSHRAFLSPDFTVPTSNTYELSLILPVGNRSLIYAYASRVVFGFQYSAYTLYNQRHPTTGAVLWQFQVADYGSLSTTTVRIEKAFLIGPSTVREISMPTAVQARLRNFMPTATPSLETFTAMYPDDVAFTPRTYIVGGTASPVTYQKLKWTITPPVDTAWSTWSGTNARADPLFNNPEIPTSRFDIYSGGGTAAIYPLWTDGATWKTGSNQGAIAAYEKARNITPDIDSSFGLLPDFVPGVGAAAKSSLQYLYTSGTTLAYSAGADKVRNTLSTSKVSRPEGDPISYTYTDNGGGTQQGNWDCVLLTAYDWGSPSFCRAQLLALGFTPADLTP